MTRDEIVAHVKQLNLPAGSYVVFGSCPLAAAGIREANDIDLLVSPDSLEVLKHRGWKRRVKGPDDAPYIYGVFEAHSDWKFSHYNPTLEHLLATATAIDDIPFAALTEVRKWKAASGRPKDFTDIQLIDTYLAGSV